MGKRAGVMQDAECFWCPEMSARCCRALPHKQIEQLYSPHLSAYSEQQKPKMRLVQHQVLLLLYLKTKSVNIWITFVFPRFCYYYYYYCDLSEVPVIHYLNTHLIQLNIVQTHPFYDDKCGHWCGALKAAGQRCGAALLGGADMLFLLRCLSVPVWKPRWGGGQRCLPGPEIWAAGKLTTTTASFFWQGCCSLIDHSLLRCKWANLSPALNTFASSIETTLSKNFLLPMSFKSDSEWL